MVDKTYIVGPTGPQGEPGEQGEQGNIGPRGPIGKIGPTGPQGNVGCKGEIGDTGSVGPIGPTGSQGQIGPKGEKGDVGPAGIQGNQGEKGDSVSHHPINCITVEFFKKENSIIIYKVPTNPSGPDRFILTSIIIRLEKQIIGFGNINLKVGLNNNDDGILKQITINKNNNVGILAGVKRSDLGSSMIEDNNYSLICASGDNIILSLSYLGQILDGAIKVYVYGYLID
jgi:hypothetical protein